MSTRKQHWIGWAVACGIIAGILLILLGGCETAKLKRDAKKFDKVMLHAKVDSVVVRVDRMHTDTVTIFGDVQSVNCDSIVRAAMDEASLQALNGSPVDYRTKTIVKWKTPIETFIFDTVWQSRDVYVENMAKVELLQKKVAAADNSGGKMRWKRNMWRGIAGILFVLLLLDLILRKGKTVNVRA